MVVFAILLFVYVVATEALDWLGRMELIETHWPMVGAAIASRKLRLLLLFFGIALLVKVLLEPRQAPITPTVKQDLAKLPAAPILPEISAKSSLGTEMVLPDGRTITSSSLEDLQAAYHASTLDHFNRLLAGKWIKLSVKVEDNWGGGLIYVAIQKPPALLLQFDRGWGGELAGLRRGSAITVRCKLAEARLSSIKLEACEFL